MFSFYKLTLLFQPSQVLKKPPKCTQGNFRGWIWEWRWCQFSWCKAAEPERFHLFETVTRVPIPASKVCQGDELRKVVL